MRGAYRTFFPEGNDLDAPLVDAALDEIAARRRGPAMAETDVVFAGAARVGVALDSNMNGRIPEEDPEFGVQRLPRCFVQIGSIKAKVDRDGERFQVALPPFSSCGLRDPLSLRAGQCRLPRRVSCCRAIRRVAFDGCRRRLSGWRRGGSAACGQGERGCQAGHKAGAANSFDHGKGGLGGMSD
jgi:hypothetical protein